ncbi:MAG: alginate export family protein [Gemmatimonadales bacterium]
MLPAAPAAGQDTTPAARPVFQALRYEEDWSALRDPRLHTGRLDRLKYLPLDGAGRIWASLGGETRLRYEQFRNPLFGGDPPDAGGYLLHRYLVHADLHVGQRLRVFVQLQAALASGRTGGPRAFDENGLDLHQAFGELSLGSDRLIAVRIGRQELDVGSSRLVSAREMVNVRQTFDGLRVLLGPSRSRGTLWVLRPVLVERGVFDDSADSTRLLWGASWIRRDMLGLGGTLTAYYIGLDRRGARFDQGTADELRHTVGVRANGARGAWDYNLEANGQFGRFGTGRIRAWDAAADNGVRLRRVPLRPRLGLRIDVTSGDRDPDDADLGTFNPLFPNTAYSGLSGLVGPANSIDLQPSVRAFVSSRLSVVGGLTLFWRTSRRDGLYGIAVNPQRPGGPSRARSVGRQLALEVDWTPSPNVVYQLTLTHCAVGPYLRDTPPGADVRYFLSWISYRF